MRELKFRAWDNQGKHWYPAETMKDFFNYLSEKFTIIADWFNEDAISLEQYTGLKDANGKEIYEGDIVEYDWYIRSLKAYRVKKQVKFDDMGARVGNDRIRNCSNVEVIGNIHDNPELLKEEE